MDDAERTETFPIWIVAALCLVAILDLAMSRVTIPVLYTVPILLYALSHRRRWLWLLAGLSVAFSFGGLAVKAHYFPLPPGQRMMGWRLLNRSFASASVCLSAALLYYWVGFYSVIKELTTKAEENQAPGDSNGYRQVLQSVTALLAIIVGGTLTACILIADFFAPPAANIPILYAVPLILVTLWMESRRVMWYLLPFMLVFAVIGQFWGPPMTLTVITLHSLFMNRFLAIGALILIAIILHISLGKTVQPKPSLEGQSVAQA